MSLSLSWHISASSIGESVYLVGGVARQYWISESAADPIYWRHFILQGKISRPAFNLFKVSSLNKKKSYTGSIAWESFMKFPHFEKKVTALYELNASTEKTVAFKNFRFFVSACWKVVVLIMPSRSVCLITLIYQVSALYSTALARKSHLSIF